MHLMKSLTRGQVARASRIGTETVRFYESEGLLPPTPRSSNGYRYYPEDTVQRLNFIRRAKKLGFNLKEIKELLSLHDNPDASRAAIKTLTESKLMEIKHRIADLERMRKVLTHLAAECSGEGQISSCPIIHTLESE